MTANPFSRRGLSTVPLLAPLLVATACASSRPAIAPQAPMATTADAKSNVPNPVPTSGTIAVSADIRAACGISDEDAYFTFDSAALENKDISPLDAIARCFTVGPLKGRGMRLVGHADPRGSSEYKPGAGAAPRRLRRGYLDRHGVAHSHLATTSRGSMDATGHDEATWTRDRRVDVMLGSG